MNLPLNPKAIAAEALKSGALRVAEPCVHDWAIHMIWGANGYEKPGLTKCLKCGEVDPTCTKAFRPLLTPEEAGISVVHPTPKSDGRKSPRLRPLKPNHRPRYVISKGEAQKLGYKIP
jgi:hypothetical protein